MAKLALLLLVLARLSLGSVIRPSPAGVTHVSIPCEKTFLVLLLGEWICPLLVAPGFQRTLRI